MAEEKKGREDHLLLRSINDTADHIALSETGLPRCKLAYPYSRQRLKQEMVLLLKTSSS